MTPSPKWEVRYVEGGKSVELLGAYDDGTTARRMMRGCPSAACMSYGGVVRDERGGTTERQSRLMRIAVSAAWGKRPRVEPPPVEREPAEAEEPEEVDVDDGEIATNAEETAAPRDANSPERASQETPSPQADREEALDAPADVVAAELPEHVIAAPIEDAGNPPAADYQSPAEARESEPAAVVIPVAGEAPTAPVERPRRSRSSATSTKRRVARETSLSELIDALVAVTAQELDALLRRAVAERLAHLKSAVVGGAR